VRARAALALLLAACAGREPDALIGQSKPAPLPPEVELPSEPSAAPSASATPREDPRIATVLSEVSSLRGLPIKSKVRTQVVDRSTVLAKAKKKLAEELPPGVLERQGDAYRALELVPADYDLEDGLLKLLTARVAGFYDPDEKAMYLLDDLSSRQDDETLPHELVHALQDQSFDIGPMLDYVPGQNDRLTAAQHLVEGDATIYGFLHAYGDDFRVEHSALRAAFYNPTALSLAGSETPLFLLGSLVSPYVEGYIFVESIRNAGGSGGIDAAFKRLPVSTEQILHPQKYASGEAPLAVPRLTAKALGDAFKPVYDDSNGELGLRLMLEQWTSEPIAAKAAAGWGGDRIVVFGSGSGKTRTAALAFVTRMDSENDAIELEKVVQSKFGRGCRERADIGPIAWTRRGRDLLLAAGPFQVDDGSVTSSAKCGDTSKWLRELTALK
jgi:hypothetical protein